MMLRLTDLAGNLIWFNPEHIGIVRDVSRGESGTNARAAVETYSGTLFVQESVADVIKKLG